MVLALFNIVEDAAPADSGGVAMWSTSDVIQAVAIMFAVLIVATVVGAIFRGGDDATDD